MSATTRWSREALVGEVDDTVRAVLAAPARLRFGLMARPLVDLPESQRIEFVVLVASRLAAVVDVAGEINPSVRRRIRREVRRRDADTSHEGRNR